jgi:hypothetical protein
MIRKSYHFGIVSLFCSSSLSTTITTLKSAFVVGRGICDTDCNPNIITYPIPSNDDIPKLIEFYLILFQQAIMAGKEKRREKDLLNQ